MSSRVKDKDSSDETVAPENSTEESESHRIVARMAGDSSVQSVYEAVAECGPSQGVAAGHSSDAPPTQLPKEHCAGILYSTLSQPNSSELVIVNTKGFAHGVGKPKEYNFNSSQNVADRSRTDDITVNLSNFLTRPRRNHCDLVIPPSQSYFYPSSSYLDSGHRIVISEQQNFTRPSSTATSYHPNEFIGLNHVSSRNSVLMPNLYSGPDDIRPPVVDFSAPPPYDTPFKLPTYEEVQREKELEADNTITGRENQNTLSSRTLSLLTVDGEAAAAAAAAAADTESKLLGTDFMFIISFFLALIFNWVGFLLLLCFCHTVAARYGALSGFGLSLAKWTIIVKQTSAAPLHNVWLWWLIAIFGLLICIRSLFQYIHIKRGWRLMSATMQERLLVYY